MLYRKFSPRGLAKRYVKAFWILEDGAPSRDVQRILPDGRCELILNLAQPFETVKAGRWTKQPQHFLVGQITRPMLLRPCGPAAILGVSFHPEGASLLLNVSGDEFTDQQIALDQISRCLRNEILPVHDLATWPSRLAAVENTIAAIARASGKYDRQISFAVSEFERTFGTAPVGRVSDQLGLTRRHFERRFKAAVGISPKLFCRMQRVQHVLRCMDDPRSKWADTAIACGYYDQAHLIRDFREFAGEPPTALLNEEIGLARHFAR